MAVINISKKLDETETISQDNIKSLPSNIDAEKAVLGSFLNNNDNVNKVADFLLTEHFYVPLHRKIYESILKFVEKGLIASPITLKNYFDKEETLEKAGVNSLDYLLKLSANSASVINLLPYARDIYETFIKRSLINIGEEVVHDAYEHNVETHASNLIEQAEQKLFNLALNGIADSGFMQLRSSLLESIRRIKAVKEKNSDISGITTGYIDLDKLLGGMQPSDLLILAARPSMGKTSLAMNIAFNAALAFMKETEIEKKKSVGIFSLEMSAEQIANRLLSIKTNIDASRIRIGNITPEEFKTLVDHTAELSDLPIYIDDTPALSISAIRTRARRLKRQNNLGLIVVDYLQLLRSASPTENRVQEIGEISQGLKAIAKELDIPVMALSQLSRAVESRDDKKPLLSDLRESGNIEQDADVVIFIYRDEYYLSRKRPQEGETEKLHIWQQEMEKVRHIAHISIAKQRNGPIGDIQLRFDRTTTGFNNLENSKISQY